MTTARGESAAAFAELTTLRGNDEIGYLSPPRKRGSAIRKSLTIVPGGLNGSPAKH
jgi:hypothetical protein